MKNKSNLLKSILPVSMIIQTLNSGCGGGTTAGNPVIQEDSSISGAAASAVGGALSGTASHGTLALLQKALLPRPTTWVRVEKSLNFLPLAQAADSCPTFRSREGAGCMASGSTLWIHETDCTIGSNSLEGVLAITSSSGTAAHCGTFPDAGPADNITRQYVAASGSTTPGTFVETHSSGARTEIDDSSANLKNFDNATIPTIANGGYGSQVGFNSSGARNSLKVAHRIVTTGVMDHSITGNLTITETENTSTSRKVSGTVQVYHNALQIVGSSTFTDATHTDDCCLPISGTITTTFSAGTTLAPTTQGSKYLGKSETLTLTGCGTGTLQNADGSSVNITLNRCF